MKNYNTLVNLIKKLSNEELKSLLKFLKYYSDKNNWSKSIDLVNLILENGNSSIIEIQKKIYGKTNLFAFNKLVDRLKDKILEVVLFDTNLSKKYYTERVQVLFDLKKKLIQCDILSLKGLRDDSDLLCKKIISRAEKYEHYEIVMDALLIRQRFVNIRKKQKEVRNIQIGIQNAESKNKSIVKSQFIYNSILNKINNSSNPSSYYDELKISVDEIEEEYNLYHSDLVGYYFYFLKTELFQIEENYVKAEECLEMINKLIVKKSIFSESRMGSTLLNLSNNNIYLGKFDIAILNANSAKKYFPNNVFNQALVEESLFYSYYFKGNYSEAGKRIKWLVGLPISNNILFSMNKWNYLHAIIDFINKDYKSCIQRLNSVMETDKDKEGWNINKRLLLIMSKIELYEFESVDLQVVSLEKFVKRCIKKGDIKERYIYILRILIKLINSNYNFKKTYESRKQYFQLINSNTIDLKWKIKSPEMIEFVSWFKTKV